MADYKLTAGGGIIFLGRLSIPADPANRHYVEFLAWLALGNTPDPADVPTAEQLAAEEAVRQAPIGAKAWFESHPNAKLLFSLSIADLEIEINSLADALLPLATAPNRTRLKLLLMAISVTIRILVKRENLG